MLRRGKGIAVTLRKAGQVAFESMGKKRVQHIGESRHELKKK